MHYTGQFKSISGTLYQVDFISNGDDSSVTNLILADDPVHIQTNPDNDLLFTPT